MLQGNLRHPKRRDATGQPALRANLLCLQRRIDEQDGLVGDAVRHTGCRILQQRCIGHHHQIGMGNDPSFADRLPAEPRECRDRRPAALGSIDRGILSLVLAPCPPRP